MVIKTASTTICLLISKGVAPNALRTPISFVRSFTVINKMFPIANTPAIKVAIPTNQVKNCIPVKKPVIFLNSFPKLKLPKARLSSGWISCKFLRSNFASSSICLMSASGFPVNIIQPIFSP